MTAVRHGKYSALNPQKILVRATNWVGDAVMSLPALAAFRNRFPEAHIAILAKPWVADLYGREPFCDRVIPYTPQNWREKLAVARALKKEKFDWAILLQNAFEAAAVAFLAGIPVRIGYARDGRGLLLTDAIPVPRAGEIPRHERFYYLELLRRAGVIEQMPKCETIELTCAPHARQQGLARFAELGLGDSVIGMSPGAAYGTAKRWLPERFAEAAASIARQTGSSIALFGSKDERNLCDAIARQIPGVTLRNFAGKTSLAEYIDLAAACRLYLTNDSGGMHIASALGVPTVAIFGATDDATTGPTGALSNVVREKVECSPCLKRECPIDHRCMTRVDAERVALVALDLLK